MKTYDVEITRRAYQTESFVVEAKNKKEAMEKALEEAHNTVFDSDDGADYSVETVLEVEGVNTQANK